MLTSSAKAKGRNLQQWVRDCIYGLFSMLKDDDVTSTSMGAQGLDVKLSPYAKAFLPYAIECKSRESMTIYSYYDQAVKNKGNLEPLLIVKENRRRALAVVDAEHFFTLVRRARVEDEPRLIL